MDRRIESTSRALGWRSFRGSHRSLRAVFTAAALALVMWAIPTLANAAPASANASLSTSKGASGSGRGGGYNWPPLVVAGNGISVHAPLQIGAVGYLPKARFAFQYDRQIRRSHWVHVGVAFLADRASFKNFRMDNCGLEDGAGNNPIGRCGKGSVLGYDLYAGYSYKFFLQKTPWLVPIVRGSLGFSSWKLPAIRGGFTERAQGRTKSWTLNVRPGGGIRVFLRSNLGVGADVNIPIGFLVHTDEPGGATNRSGGFLLGFEILPLVGEFRF
ncbi:MAG: hypothetical protein JKY37_18000 [Nannocystaceae bacterium]|nr:hypothetical protein [Nannocystaceae bacterium]